MKKVILYLLIAVLSASPAIALADTVQTEEPAVVTTAEVKTTTMTITDALNYALENAPDVIAAELNLKYYEEVYAQSASAWRSMFDVTATSDEMYLVKSGYRLSQAEMAVTVAKRSLQQAIATTKANVSKNFYTYISSAEKIKIAENALAQANTRLEQAEVKYSTGAISALDVNSFKTAVLSAENKLAQAKRACDINMETLKNCIGYPQKDVLCVSGTLDLNENVKIPSLDEVRVLIEEKNPNLLALKQTMELEERMMKNYDGWYTSNTYVHRVQKALYDKTMQGYESQLNAIRLSVSQIYNVVASANEAYKETESNLENLRKLYEVAKAQYEMGLAPATDFIDMSQQLTDVENAVLDIKVNVILATSNYLALYNEDYVELSSQTETTENN